MNMLSLIERTAEQDLESAIASANHWTLAAAPIVRAIFAMEDLRWEVLRGCDDRTGEEAERILRKPTAELREMVEGIRDNFMCDVVPDHTGFGDGDDPRWEERDAFIEETQRGVISAAAFIKQMEMEA